MKKLIPSSRGIFIPQTKSVKTGGYLQAYPHPTKILQNFDQVINQKAPPRILITRKQGGIGDVLMTLPTVKAIQKKYNAIIDYGTDFNYLHGALRKVLLHNDYINNVLNWKNADLEDYNLAIDLTCPCVIHEKPRAHPINRIDLFARHVGISLEDKNIDYTHTEQELEWAKNYIIDNRLSNHELILVQSSSSSKNRDCPPDVIKRAMVDMITKNKRIRFLVITHGTDNVKTNWNGYNEIHVLHNFDIRQLAAIMHYCKLVLCPDSAILHMASALCKPTVTLFGPTDPRARINYHPEAVALWCGVDLKNYPLWYEPCKNGYICWKRLEPELISQTCLSLLQKKPLPNHQQVITFQNYQR